MAKVDNLQILDLLVQNPGLTDAELGQKLGLSRSHVNRRRKDPAFRSLFKGKIEEDFWDSYDMLKAAHIKAIRRICNAVESSDDKVALKAASLIYELFQKAPERKKASSRESRLNALIEVGKILNR